MLFQPKDDRYDELRREWIAEHAGIFTVQIRRAELLNRRIRRRYRDLAGARPNPHDDHPSHPLLTRGAKTVEARIELTAVVALALLAPLGWAAGKFLYQRIETLIPQRLRSYPIPALLLAALILGAVTVLAYRPGDTLTSAIIAPWLMAQLPATALAAGVYGILNGWLAINGSTHWWPLAPPPPEVDMSVPLLADDLTAPSIFETIEHTESVDLTPLAGPVRPLPQSKTLVLAGVVLNAIGILWTCGAAGVGVKTVISESLTPTSTIGANEPR
ncbi:MAG: hypothetical protein K0U78_20215 [Actinomycetia bacterium]|nr:hypothetical protein [Actinomycetes bacterium]